MLSDLPADFHQRVLATLREADGPLTVSEIRDDLALGDDVDPHAVGLAISHALRRAGAVQIGDRPAKWAPPTIRRVNDEPLYRKRMQEERDQQERIEQLEIRRLRFYLDDNPGATVRQIAAALRRGGEPMLLDPWLRRLERLVEAGEVRRLHPVQSDGLARFVLTRRVLTADELVALGVVRPEPPPVPYVAPSRPTPASLPVEFLPALRAHVQPIEVPMPRAVPKAEKPSKLTLRERILVALAEGPVTGLPFGEVASRAGTTDISKVNETLKQLRDEGRVRQSGTPKTKSARWHLAPYTPAAPSRVEPEVGHPSEDLREQGAASPRPVVPHSLADRILAVLAAGPAGGVRFTDIATKVATNKSTVHNALTSTLRGKVISQQRGPSVFWRLDKAVSSGGTDAHLTETSSTPADKATAPPVAEDPVSAPVRSEPVVLFATSGRPPGPMPVALAESVRRVPTIDNDAGCADGGGDCDGLEVELLVSVDRALSTPDDLDQVLAGVGLDIDTDIDEATETIRIWKTLADRTEVLAHALDEICRNVNVDLGPFRTYDGQTGKPRHFDAGAVRAATRAVVEQFTAAHEYIARAERARRELTAAPSPAPNPSANAPVAEPHHAVGNDDVPAAGVPPRLRDAVAVAEQLWRAPELQATPAFGLMLGLISRAAAPLTTGATVDDLLAELREVPLSHLVALAAWHRAQKPHLQEVRNA
jgi:hypothetical protein